MESIKELHIIIVIAYVIELTTSDFSDISFEYL